MTISNRELTVYVVRHVTKEAYYGSGVWGLVDLKDAKIFSKKGTATACSNRMRDCKVLTCKLIIEDHNDDF
jgi:hypothetical protein